MPLIAERTIFFIIVAMMKSSKGWLFVSVINLAVDVCLSAMQGR